MKYVILEGRKLWSRVHGPTGSCMNHPLTTLHFKNTFRIKYFFYRDTKIFEYQYIDNGHGCEGTESDEWHKGQYQKFRVKKKKEKQFKNKRVNGSQFRYFK